MIAITPPLRRGLFLLVVGLLVLEGCFAFPLVNLTHPEYNRALWDIVFTTFAYLSAGVLARMLLGPRCLGKMLGLVLPATAVGSSAGMAWSTGKPPSPTPSPCPTAPSTWRPQPGSPFWGPAWPTFCAAGNR